MEIGLVDKARERVGYVKRVVAKQRNKPYCRVKRHVPKSLQQLFHSCKQTFKGPETVPVTQDVHQLCHILDNMKPEDVGLSRDLQFFKPGNIIKENQRVAYTNVYKCDNFSVCIFFLPEKGVIPLHNHPGMTVFSKLLLGQMHIKSYDWVDPEASHTSKCENSLCFSLIDTHSWRSESPAFDNMGQFTQIVECKQYRSLMKRVQLLVAENDDFDFAVRLAKLKENKVFTSPCDTSVLYPTTGGNIHEFTAITPCAVLDVIGPPYSKEDDRDCSYYKDFPNEKEIGEVKDENDSYAMLEEIEMPENCPMDGIEYLGPPIDETVF